MKTIISTGQGRLHLIESAKALKKVGIATKVITGWVPSTKIPNGFINFLGRMVGRPNLAAGLRKRNFNDFSRKDVYTCAFAEFFIQFLFIISKFKLLKHDTAALLGWQIFGWQSKKYLKNVDVFHVRSGAGQGGAIQKAKENGLKVVVDHSIAHPAEVNKQIMKANRGNNEDIFISEKSKFWQLVLKDCYDADIIQVNSEYVKTSFINNGFEPHKIRVIPLGIRKEFWNLKTHYISNKSTKLLFTGGFGLRKGANLIIEACEQLIQMEFDFSIDILGSIIDDVTHPKWFTEHPNIKVHGFLPQEELFKFLAESDIYIFPSYSEGAAQSLKEAMAAGMPVIATAQSGAPIQHEINGMIISDNSVSELVHAIQNLSRNAKTQKQLGQNAAKTIQEEHTWESYGFSVNALYQDLINNTIHV